MVPHNRQVCKCIVQVDKSLCQGKLSLRARVACTPQLVRVYFLEQVHPDFSASDGLKEGIDQNPVYFGVMSEEELERANQILRTKFCLEN